jgi:glycosyltransferase involved in cell wall biosynthesis
MGHITASTLPAPVIEPVPEGTRRPFWSVMIPVYNSADYMRETLRCVLAQDPGADEMDIEVVDNCSTTDDPEAVVRELGGGRIKFHRQAENVGAIGNFNTCISRSRGQWLHILHADDIVRPGFYERARQAIIANPQVSAVNFRTLLINESGLWTGLAMAEMPNPGILGDDFIARQLRSQRIQCVGIVVRRSVYEELGGYRPELGHCTDWEMWNRIAVQKKIFYDPEPLACYRLHSGADTIELSCSYVPEDQGKRLYREAMNAAAKRAIRRMRQHWREGDRAIAWHQFREAVLCGIASTAIF